MEWKKYSTESAGEIFGKLRTAKEGLSEADAKRRLLEFGKNTLEERDHYLARILRRRLTSLLLWVLVLVAAVTFLAGDYFETFLILLFLAINICLEVYQEFHSERAAKFLQHYLISEIKTWRDGRLVSLKASLLVPGDSVVLEAGNRVPADIRIINQAGFLVDESVLTGESISLPKSAEPEKRAPGNVLSVSNTAFAGTVVVAGRAEGIVVATGSNTAMGDVAHLAFSTEKETVFEQHVREFSRFLVKLLGAALVLVFCLYFVIHGQSVPLLEMLLFTLVLAITVVPEALPTITTIALSRGALQLAKKNVIVKRLSAIEDLGSVEILCVDKTGTITENNLQVSHIYGDKKKEVLQYALLAAQNQAVSFEVLRDSFDKALYIAVGSNEAVALRSFERTSELPFDAHTRMNGVVLTKKNEKFLIVRGAPEEILRKVEHLDAYTRKHLFEWIGEAGMRGERVLAVACKKDYQGKDFSSMAGLTFTGLVSFLDPLKKDARETLEEAKKLGVTVKIFSGDSKEVVGAVAYSAGVVEEAQKVMTGTEFEQLSLPEQIHCLETHHAFARFSPIQKYGALKLLQKSHSVGFLGEGVNDAPALKLAHVALVVESASDVARESADILLLKKDLKVIIQGIREGRRVFANILKYLKITLAANFGNFYSITLAALFLPYLPLLPLQILLLNLLSDFPMLAIATDRVDPEKLERPNNHNMHSIIVTATLFGVVSSFFDLTIFRLFSHSEPSTLQAAWFVFSLLSEIILLYSLRTRRWFFQGEKSSWPVTVFATLVVIAAIIIPFTWFGSALSFNTLTKSTVLLLGALLVMYFVTTEIIKRWYYMHSALFANNGGVRN